MVTFERKEMCRPIDMKRKLGFLKAITAHQLWLYNFVLPQLKLRKRMRKFVELLQFVRAFFYVNHSHCISVYSNFLFINRDLLMYHDSQGLYLTNITFNIGKRQLTLGRQINFGSVQNNLDSDKHNRYIRFKRERFELFICLEFLI